MSAGVIVSECPPGQPMIQLSLFDPIPCSCGQPVGVYEMPNYGAGEWHVGHDWRCEVVVGKTEWDVVRLWNEERGGG